MACDSNGFRKMGQVLNNAGGSAIVVGDARNVLGLVPDAAFACCVTSPPYWGLRDYDIEGQVGAEDSLAEYLEHLVAIFREVRRTLAEDGTLWLNIGDSYTSGNRRWRAPDKKNPARAMRYRPPTPAGLKPKDLIGVPWRLALALQADGWYLRSDVVWHKPNCQPESVRDRPTRAHEYLFMLTRSQDYYYDREAIMEPANGRGRRNRRTVWNINTEPNGEAHFATFPEALVAPCIASSSHPGSAVLDPFAGTGTAGIACQRMGRRFIGIELKPKYARIAERRLGQELLYAKTS